MAIVTRKSVFGPGPEAFGGFIEGWSESRRAIEEEAERKRAQRLAESQKALPEYAAFEPTVEDVISGDEAEYAQLLGRIRSDARLLPADQERAIEMVRRARRERQANLAEARQRGKTPLEVASYYRQLSGKPFVRPERGASAVPPLEDVVQAAERAAGAAPSGEKPIDEIEAARRLIRESAELGVLDVPTWQAFETRLEIAETRRRREKAPDYAQFAEGLWAQMEQKPDTLISALGRPAGWFGAREKVPWSEATQAEKQAHVLNVMRERLALRERVKQELAPPPEPTQKLETAPAEARYVPPEIFGGLLPRMREERKSEGAHEQFLGEIRKTGTEAREAQAQREASTDAARVEMLRAFGRQVRAATGTERDRGIAELRTAARDARLSASVRSAAQAILDEMEKP